MALPIKLVWRLQMARSRKSAVIALFASGFVCIAFATLRVVQIGIQSGDHTSPSPTWLAFWTIVESAIAICIGCGSAFVSLYRTAHSPSVSYDTNGYVRRCGRDTVLQELRPVAMNTSRKPACLDRRKIAEGRVYLKDTTNSQEALAADTSGISGIKITTTLHQDISSNPSSDSFHDPPRHVERSLFAVA
jgi:hypothetical protein